MFSSNETIIIEENLKDKVEPIDKYLEFIRNDGEVKIYRCLLCTTQPVTYLFPKTNLNNVFNIK